MSRMAATAAAGVNVAITITKKKWVYWSPTSSIMTVATARTIRDTSSCCYKTMFSTTSIPENSSNNTGVIVESTSTSSFSNENQLNQNNNKTNNNNDNRTRILSLYRSIRKLHNKSLPSELREMGNTYVQAEFRTLKEDNKTKMTEQQFQNFMIEWERYKEQIQYQYQQKVQLQQPNKNEVKYGQPLPSDVQLNTEQLEQLQKLHQEVTHYTSTTAGSRNSTPTNNKLG